MYLYVWCVCGCIEANIAHLFGQTNFIFFIQNNPFHDNQALKLYDELKASDLLANQHQKTLAILGAIRLKQNKPQDCLQMLSTFDDVDVTTRYVRLLAHLKLNEFDQVFRLLRLTTTGAAGSNPDRNVPKIPDQLVSWCSHRIHFAHVNFPTILVHFSCISTNWWLFRLLWLFQLQQVRTKVMKSGDKQAIANFNSIYGDIKRLDRVLFKVSWKRICCAFHSKSMATKCLWFSVNAYAFDWLTIIWLFSFQSIGNVLCSRFPTRQKEQNTDDHEIIVNWQ